MLKVNVLGRFHISNEQGRLDDDSIRSAMLTKLLVFLILNRTKQLTSDAIAAGIWEEDEVDNPTGALKNLMYRLRTTLKKNLGEEDFILTNRGAYSFNTKIPVEIDAEKFEKRYLAAKNDDVPIEEAILYYEQAIDLYQGDFMLKDAAFPWVITLSAYYHSMFLSCVKGLAELYVLTGRYEDLEERCMAALSIDHADEELYYYLVLARMKQNKISLAMESYEKAKQILHDELGIRNSKQLSSIYGELLKAKKGIEAEEMADVCRDMTEDNPQGAFFCGYPVFKEIYRLEARKIERSEQKEYVLLLTIKNQKGKELTQELEAFYMEKMMNRLAKLISDLLRIGDVVAKYSDSQFITLLPSCDEESGKLVMQRIMAAYKKDNPRYEFFPVEGNLEPVSSAKSWME